MTDAEVSEVVKRALKKVLPPGDEADMDTPFFRSSLDSSWAVRMCAEIGQQLNVPLSPAHITKESTGRDIVAIVSKLRSK